MDEISLNYFTGDNDYAKDYVAYQNEIKHKYAPKTVVDITITLCPNDDGTGTITATDADYIITVSYSGQTATVFTDTLTTGNLEVTVQTVAVWVQVVLRI